MDVLASWKNGPAADKTSLLALIAADYTCAQTAYLMPFSELVRHHPKIE
jgi:hypothetical protein